MRRRLSREGRIQVSSEKRTCRRAGCFHQKASSRSVSQGGASLANAQHACPDGIPHSRCDFTRGASLQLGPVCTSRSFAQAARAGGRSKHDESLRGARATAKGTARDSRERAARGWRQQRALFGRDVSDVVDVVGSLAKLMLARAEPLNLDLVPSLDRFERTKPACAMTG